MTKDNRFFEDLNRLASSALESASSVRREATSYIRQCVESFIRKMDFVTKDELEVVKKIALHTAKELESLKKSLGVPQSSQGKPPITTPRKEQARRRRKTPNAE